jgi:outer membrane biosynthesis protein TonB
VTGARQTFDAQDITIACAVALLAQLVFLAAFSLPSPKLVQADISNDNAQPIAVAITPVLKLGSKTAMKLPSAWQRRQPVAAKSQAPLPSPQAEKTLEAIPKAHVPDAGVAPVVADAAPLEQPNLTLPEDAKAAAPVASAEGSEQGSATGTETDPLRARAADGYRDQLARWFAARFHIAGKIPFDRLKTLSAFVKVTVTEDRRVGSFSVLKPSGDPTFDAEVNATLTSIQSSGVEVPAPPEMYPEMLAKSQNVNFHCSDSKRCE